MAGFDKFGVGRCCCGCSVLDETNDVTQDAFESHYELGEDSAEPAKDADGVWTTATPTFTGDMTAAVVYNRASYADDNIGMDIRPTGDYSELRYDYSFSSVVYSYVWNYEIIDNNELVCNRFRLLKAEAALFDSDDFPCDDLTAILSTTRAYIIRRKDRNDADRVCFYVGDHLIDRQREPEIVDLTIPVEISIGLKGTNYSLDATAGFVHLFKPDKFWLYPENLPSSQRPARSRTITNPATRWPALRITTNYQPKNRRNGTPF